MSVAWLKRCRVSFFKKFSLRLMLFLETCFMKYNSSLFLLNFHSFTASLFFFLLVVACQFILWPLEIEVIDKWTVNKYFCTKIKQEHRNNKSYTTIKNGFLVKSGFLWYQISLFGFMLNLWIDCFFSYNGRKLVGVHKAGDILI